MNNVPLTVNTVNGTSPIKAVLSYDFMIEVARGSAEVYAGFELLLVDN